MRHGLPLLVLGLAREAGLEPATSKLMRSHLHPTANREAHYLHCQSLQISNISITIYIIHYCSSVKFMLN